MNDLGLPLFQSVLSTSFAALKLKGIYYTSLHVIAPNVFFFTLPGIYYHNGMCKLLTIWYAQSQ